MIEKKEYTHVTSPMRRIIDMLNQIGWVKNHVKPERIGKKVKEYYEKEEKRVKERTERIKKESQVEREVRMLKEVTKEPEVMSKKYIGEIISKKGKKLVMYIKKKGWIMEMEEKEEEKEEIGSEKEIRVYVFENEEKMSRKIRGGIYPPNPLKGNLKVPPTPLRSTWGRAKRALREDLNRGLYPPTPYSLRSTWDM